jgi:hypothetical protein
MNNLKEWRESVRSFRRLVSIARFSVKCGQLRFELECAEVCIKFDFMIASCWQIEYAAICYGRKFRGYFWIQKSISEKLFSKHDK